LDSQRAKYSNLLEKNSPAHTQKTGNDDHNAVVSSSTSAALPLPLPPAPPAPPALPAAVDVDDDDDDDYDLKLSLFKNLKRNANIENLSLAAVQPNNKRYKLPFNLQQRDSMLEKVVRSMVPNFIDLKK